MDNASQNYNFNTQNNGQSRFRSIDYDQGSVGTPFTPTPNKAIKAIHIPPPRTGNNSLMKQRIDHDVIS